MADKYPLSPAEDGMLSTAEERFETARKKVGLWLGPLFCILLLLFPMDGVTPAAATLAAILALTLTWWMTEPVPIPVTAILAPALCVALGIAEAKELFAAFGDPIIFLFMGGFILARAMTVHGLDRRIALGLLGLKWVGNSVARVYLVFGGIAWVLSMWLSNTATVAMMAPIGLGIIGEMREMLSREGNNAPPTDHVKLATGLLLILTYASSIGGIATPIGTPPNLIAIGLIRNQLDLELSFTRWMLFALPGSILLFAVLYALTLIMYRTKVHRIEGLSDFLAERKLSLGRWTRGQVNTLVAFFTAVILWVLPGILVLIPLEQVQIFKERYTDVMPEGVVAVLAASLLFLLPVNLKKNEFTMNWQQAVKIDWGTILLFGGGIALGKLAFSTGLARALGDSVISGTGVSSLGMITLMTIIFSTFITEATSNTASATMVVPVAISVAQAAGVDPLPPALGACLAASCGFMLPVSTPPNAIVYGTGFVPITRMVKTGFILDWLGIAVIWGVVMLFSGILH